MAMKYFDMYFENSYHEKLSKLGKDALKSAAKQKLDDLAFAVDFSQEPKTLLKSIERRFYEEAPYVDYPTFACDFSEDKRKRWGDERNDCILYSQLVVAALENSGRNDVLEKLDVKEDDDHCWLSYNNELEINSFGKIAKTTHGKERLVLTGMNNTVMQLLQKGLNHEALEVIEKGISVNGTFKYFWLNRSCAFASMGKRNEADAAMKEYKRLSSIQF